MKTPLLKKEVTLWHYTVNTGHSRKSPKSEVDPGTLRRLASVLGDGEIPIPWEKPGYRALISLDAETMRFGVCQGKRTVALCEVVPTDDIADMVFATIADEYHDYKQDMEARWPGVTKDWKEPVQPDSTPWLSEILLHIRPGDSWIADFNRCLAWAYLESLTARN